MRNDNHSLADVGSLPLKERPREKMRVMGPDVLSDLELLAVLLGSGTRGIPVHRLAQRVLPKLDQLGPEDSPYEALTAIRGLGPAKIALLAAALEFGRRRISPRAYRIQVPEDAVPLLMHYADRCQEYFLCLSLNGAHEIITRRVVTIGTVNRTMVHPREVFADPLKERAAAVLVAHNHPSGNLQPSSEDRRITAQLMEAGETLGIKLLDHIIFTIGGYYSFIENGEMPPTE